MYPLATGSAALLAIVVENLLSKARKFTAGESEARIEVVGDKREGRPVFSVRDNGCGFDPACANRLFTPCQRLPAAHQYPGIGISAPPPSRACWSAWAAPARRRGGWARMRRSS
jgi:light-regulated signal transduction histidine kinase (bacteriophytochrome)